VFLLLSIFFFCSCFLINNKGIVMQSARLMPMMITSVMLLLSLVSLIKNIRAGGFPGPAKIWHSIKAGLQSESLQSTLLAILIVAIYIFFGLAYLGFYLSSMLLIGFISLFYVRRIKPYQGILIAVLLTALLYVVFRMGLGMNL
jgi:hypothetical protein